VKEIRARGGLNLLINSLFAMQEKFTEVIAGIKNWVSKEKLVSFYNEIKDFEGSNRIIRLAADLYNNLNKVDVNVYSTVIEEFAKKNFLGTPRTPLTKANISLFKSYGLAIMEAAPVVPYGDGFKPSEGKEAVRLKLLYDSKKQLFQGENDPFAIETDGYIYHQKPISTETHVAFKLKENAFELKENAFELKENAFELKENAFELKENAFELKENVWVLLGVNSLINRTFLYPADVENLALKDNENGKSDLIVELITNKVKELGDKQAPIKSIIKKSMLLDEEFERKGEKIVDLWMDKINGIEYEKFLKSLIDDVKSLSIYKENEFFKDRADQLIHSLKAVSTRSSFKEIAGELRQLVQRNPQKNV
jgi:hypothetical protein